MNIFGGRGVAEHLITKIIWVPTTMLCSLKEVNILEAVRGLPAMLP